MKRKIMRGCVGLMIIGLLQSATYALSMFPDISSVNVDQITNQSEQQQQQRKTPEQTYNEQYKEQIKKIISLNQEFQCLLSEAERYAETQTSVSDRALSLKTKSESVGLTIDNMECPQDIKYSKQYLKDCNVALTKALANLDLYDL
jgi:Skp family chaperone for outer membrane proteins